MDSFVSSAGRAARDSALDSAAASARLASSIAAARVVASSAVSSSVNSKPMSPSPFAVQASFRLRGPGEPRACARSLIVGDPGSEPPWWEILSGSALISEASSWSA